MRLYVWDKDFLEEWQSGMGMALANDVDEARKLIALKFRQVESSDSKLIERDLAREPDHIHDLTEPVAYYLWGSA